MPPSTVLTGLPALLHGCFHQRRHQLPLPFALLHPRSQATRPFAAAYGGSGSRSRGCGSAQQSGYSASLRSNASATSRSAARSQQAATWQTAAASINGRAVVSIPHTADERLILLERLQRNVEQTGTADGMNLVAFGGGVAATLVAYLVHSVFETNCIAVFVAMPDTTEEDARRARRLCAFLGLELWELPAPEADVSAAEEDPEVLGPKLSAALAAIRRLLQQGGDCPAVVFDGLHAENLPPVLPDQDMLLGWDGSEDSGEQPGASYASFSEAADHDVDLHRMAALLGLPAARRVSLLAGFPEIALRAVADTAGMPNWDWLSDEEAEETARGIPVSPASELPPRDALEEARLVVSQLLQLRSEDSLRVWLEGDAAAVVELDPAVIPAALSLDRILRARLAELGLEPVTIRALQPHYAN